MKTTRFLLFMNLSIVLGLVYAGVAHGDHSGWRCSASTHGYDKHGEHYASGRSRAEASSSAINRCELFHFPGACRV